MQNHITDDANDGDDHADDVMDAEVDFVKRRAEHKAQHANPRRNCKRQQIDQNRFLAVSHEVYAPHLAVSIRQSGHCASSFFSGLRQ